NFEVFNLGSGVGYTVLEAIGAFERTTGVRLNYKIGPRRPCAVEAIYSENTRARRTLGWRPARSVDEMMATAWAWEQKLAEQRLAAEKGEAPATHTAAH